MVKKDKFNLAAAGPRTSIACERCRKRHIKCDGGDICVNCKKVNAECIYVEGDKKIVISLRFLQKLKRDNEGLRKLLAHYRGLVNHNDSSLLEEHENIEDDIEMELHAICDENNCDLSGNGKSNGSSPTSVRSVQNANASPGSRIKVEDSPSSIINETSSIPSIADNTSISTSSHPPMVALPTEHGCVIIPLMESSGKIDSSGGNFQGTSSMSTFGTDLKDILPRQAQVDLNEILPSKCLRRPVVAHLQRREHTFDLEVYQECRDHPFRLSFELPSYERAVKAHHKFNHYLCGSFYFFNAFEFKTKLKDTYENMKSGTLDLPDLLWITKLLLVLALGELYMLGTKKGQKEAKEKKAEEKNVNGHNDSTDFDSSRGFTEISFFKKASCLSRILMDEVHTTPSVEAIEVLLLTSFFHQIMDWQVGAYLVNGIALRSSLLLGLHVDAGKDTFSVHELEHRRRIWWSIFHFDRYIAAKAGLPLTIYETSIFAQYPRDIEGSDGVRGEFPKADYINSFIEVTKIVSFALSELYQRQPDATINGNILPAIYEVMNRLFAWKSKWTAKLGINWNPSGTEFAITRTAANVYHEYLHCVNLTVRPLLYHFVRKRILDRHDNPGPIDLSGYSQNIITLLNASMSASLQTVQSLQHLLSVDDFATFGYLDREYCFSSASSLMLFIVAFGVSQICSPSIGKALQLLHHSELAGNGHATIRKKQLLDLTASFQFLDQSFILAIEEEESLERGEGEDDQVEELMPPPTYDNTNSSTESHHSNTFAPESSIPTPDLHQLSNISLDEFQAENINFGLEVEKDLWEEITTEASWLGNVSDEFRSLIQDSSMFGQN